MSYELKFDYYEGPLDKLLNLVEEKKLEITAVNLAEVTADFIKYVETLEAEGARGTIADFLIVASKLILIKSKVLLPGLELSEEEESDVRSLEFRLKLYKELKLAQARIKSGWSVPPPRMPILRSRVSRSCARSTQSPTERTAASTSTPFG